MEVAFKRFSRMMPARNTAGDFIENIFIPYTCYALKHPPLSLAENSEPCVLFIAAFITVSYPTL